MIRRLLVSLLLAIAVVAPAHPSVAAPTYAPGVVITKHPGSVGRNRTATLMAKTTPGSMRCSITVHYKTGPGTAAGLVAKTSAASGAISWSWKVGGRTTKGTWPITVSCGGGKYKAVSRLTVP